MSFSQDISQHSLVRLSRVRSIHFTLDNRAGLCYLQKRKTAWGRFSSAFWI